MAQRPIRYICIEGLTLTDFINGSLGHPESGRSVPATALARQIAVHFENGSAWEDFASADLPGSTQVFRDMVAAGLLIAFDAENPMTSNLPDLISTPQTMFGAPPRKLDDITPNEIVFLGAPIDFGTTGFPGARFGPNALRSASLERYRVNLSVATGAMSAWNVPALGGAVLEGARLSDAGDVPHYVGEPLQRYYDRLGRVTQAIYAAKGFPVVLGGDHSITYGSMPAKTTSLVHIDAHCDLAPMVSGHCHHHGNVLTRLLAENRISDVHHFGLRDTSGWDTVHAGTHAKSIGDLERPDWADDVAGKEVFVTFDLDVLDPTVLPGTGTPIIGGLSLRQACQVLAKIAQVTRPVGFDMVELCPMRDPAELSARVSIEALLCFLAVLYDTHLRTP